MLRFVDECHFDFSESEPIDVHSDSPWSIASLRRALHNPCPPWLVVFCQVDSFHVLEQDDRRRSGSRKSLLGRTRTNYFNKAIRARRRLTSSGAVLEDFRLVLCSTGTIQLFPISSDSSLHSLRIKKRVPCKLPLQASSLTPLSIISACEYFFGSS